ncbi:TraB/GumN family protein (plasmid) [Burkholderia ambifaria]
MKFLARLATAVGVVTVTVTAAVAGNAGVPALKVTAPDGATSLLVASLHAPYVGLRQPLPSVLRGKARLVIESSVTQGPQPSFPPLQELLAPEAMARLATQGKLGRAPWAMSLSDEEVATLRRTGQCLRPPANDMMIDVFLAMKSPAAASSVANMRCGKPGQLSRDEIFAQAAATYGVPTNVLETQVDVDRQRKAVPDRIYEVQLHSAFGSSAAHAYARTVAALNHGDYAAVLHEVNTGYTDPADAATFYRLMVEERNRAWMAPLRRYLNEGNALVLVGAAHLSGNAGLIRLLEQAGYRIEAVTLPADPKQG